jgi:hypothetical protein
MAGGHGAWDTSRVVFVTHGFKDSVESRGMHVLKNALLASPQPKPPQTVVLVGWGGGANLPHLEYKKAAGNIRSIGAWLGDVVEELRRMHPRLKIWGIGHSLGAHLMGYAARKSSGGFDRITGLDPAGPLFDDKNEDLRISRMDAAVVDIIHSDGCLQSKNPKCWVEPNNHYALIQSLGTIDFYPNYGVLNPTTRPIDIQGSHRRAVDLFIISVLHKGLFKTNETLDGSPGAKGAVERIRQVAVEAEMGYWLEDEFLPGPVDLRVNFYLSEDTMRVVDRMGDVVSQGIGGHTGGHHHRRRRALVQQIECSALPNNSGRITAFAHPFSVILVYFVLQKTYWLGQ